VGDVFRDSDALVAILSDTKLPRPPISPLNSQSLPEETQNDFKTPSGINKKDKHHHKEKAIQNEDHQEDIMDFEDAPSPIPKMPSLNSETPISSSSSKKGNTSEKKTNSIAGKRKRDEEEEEAEQKPSSTYSTPVHKQPGSNSGPTPNSFKTPIASSLKSGPNSAKDSGEPAKKRTRVSHIPPLVPPLPPLFLLSSLLSSSLFLSSSSSFSFLIPSSLLPFFFALARPPFSQLSLSCSSESNGPRK